MLSSVAWQNWFEKHRWALCDQWLKDLPERHKNDPNFKVVWPTSEAEILSLKSQNEMQWGGWYSRHNGELTYFGDHVAGVWGETVPALMLLALAGGLIAAFIVHTHAASAVPARKPAQLSPTEGKIEIQMKSCGPCNPQGFLAMIRNCLPRIFQAIGRLRYKTMKALGTGLFLTMVYGRKRSNACSCESPELPKARPSMSPSAAHDDRKNPNKHFRQTGYWDRWRSTVRPDGDSVALAR